jgi:hypothetical protein
VKNVPPSPTTRGMWSEALWGLGFLSVMVLVVLLGSRFV